MPTRPTHDEIDRMSRDELLRLNAEIEDALAALHQRNSARAFQEITAVLDKYEVTLDEVIGASRRKPAGKGVRPAKYRNPSDPSKTWSGMGRKPAWFEEHIAKGVPESSMRVD